MFRRRQIPKKAGEGENPFLLTFSDFMASLLAIFILVLIVTLIELEKKKEILNKQQTDMTLRKGELKKSLEDIKKIQESIAISLHGVSKREEALSVMLEGIKSDLKTRGVDVILTEEGFHIPEKQLQFALGKYEIPDAHGAAADAIGQVVLKYLSKPENLALFDTVFVEGHTDSVRNTREMGNWGLSTYRAISLWNYWTEKPGKLAGLKNLRSIPNDRKASPKPLISVSGYADTRSTHGLVNGQILKEDRPEDRRIDIRFTLMSSEKQNLEALQEKMKQVRGKMDALIDKL
jgi:flagellar motor protein MotB